MTVFMFKYRSNKVLYNLSQYVTLVSDILKLEAAPPTLTIYPGVKQTGFKIP